MLKEESGADTIIPGNFFQVKSILSKQLYQSFQYIFIFICSKYYETSACRTNPSVINMLYSYILAQILSPDGDKIC